MQVKDRNLMFEVAFFSLKVVKLVFVSSLSDAQSLNHLCLLNNFHFHNYM